MPDSSSNSKTLAKSKVYYGWVVVAACALMIAITYGLMYSYSVFLSLWLTIFTGTALLFR